ncbi:RecF/RecN/SMC [Chytridium lagenaria]|nr:RecF/RecN/SMC [Chytridium lagenaria]
MLTAVEPPLDAKARRLSTPANIKAEPYVPKQRLIIEKLVLRNFKSYAGTVEIGPFHKSFSSIVGPNGSGKSNVIDALLFVFGFKAKKMRQDRLSDLIHNSVGHENLDSCGVEVHFVEIIDKPGTQEYTTVDRTQLIVSRTVEKAKVDKSTYRINGRTSSFTEVTALLKGKGVDLDHKRFLILQGEVESISLMKPKGQTEHEDGLLEYLEDIIGTTKYKVKIDEANTLLDQCNEEREEKLNRLKIVEKDKNALEPRKQEAEEFISLENVVCQKKNKLYQIQKWDLEAFGVKLKEERASSSGMLTEMEILEKECKKISVDYDVRLFSDNIKDKHLKTKQKKLSKTIQQEQFSLSESKSWLANFEGDTRKANLELENLKTRQNEEEKELQAIADSLKGKTEGFKLEIAKKQQELEPWTEKINAKKSGIEVAESELALLEQRASLSDKTIKEAEERIEGFTAALQEKIGLLSEQKKNLRSTKPKYEEIQKQIAALNSEESLRSSLQASRKKLSDLREQRQSFMSRGKVLSEIMNLKESGQVNGICGRLGDLGVIDERFDVAVTTAFKSGEACLAYLKKNNLGRATFLCLDKIRAYDTSPIDTPADSKRLFDLIKIKDRKFAKVFYHALQDTLVTDDLETANKIAYGKKRFRVVTVGGNLIDISGTLSGGGSRPQRGGMSSTFLSADVVSPKVIADAEKEISQMEEELNELLSTKKNLEKLMAAFNAEIPRIESEISKLEMEVASVTQQLEQAKAEKSNAKSSVRKLTKDELARMDRLRGAITSETDQLEDLKKSALKVEAQIAQLQEKILQAGGVKLRSQKAKVDGIMQEIELCGERLINLQVERTTREKSIKKITTSVANKEKELMGIEEELGGIMEALKDVAEDDFKIRKDLLKIKEEYETQERLLTKVKKQQEDMSEAISKFRALERSLTSEIEAYTKKLKDVEKELSHTENRLKKLQLQTTGFENEDSDTVLPTFTEEDLEDFDSAILEKDIKDTQDRLNKMTPNLSVLVEYRQKHDIYLKRAADLEEVTKRRDDAKSTLDDLRKRRLDEFMDGFTAISQKLKEMYQMITLGGNAELELVDTMDPFSEGIIFSVMPPKKSWKNIANLSGGEKTLSSLALVFALHHFKPTPIYFMDEIDAALDFRNVSIVANYIKERTKDAQFIIISLRNNMFELADRLVGIYKTDNTTKSITINPALIPVS